MATANIIKIKNECANELTFNLYSSGELIFSITIPADSEETLSPGELVPSATTASEYGDNHVEISVEELPSVYYFWQNGDDIYYSLNNAWNNSTKMECNCSNAPGTSDIYLRVLESDNDIWVICNDNEI